MFIGQSNLSINKVIKVITLCGNFVVIHVIIITFIILIGNNI